MTDETEQEQWGDICPFCGYKQVPNYDDYCGCLLLWLDVSFNEIMAGALYDLGGGEASDLSNAFAELDESICDFNEKYDSELKAYFKISKSERGKLSKDNGAVKLLGLFEEATGYSYDEYIDSYDSNQTNLLRKLIDDLGNVKQGEPDEAPGNVGYCSATATWYAEDAWEAADLIVNRIKENAKSISEICLKFDKEDSELNIIEFTNPDKIHCPLCATKVYDFDDMPPQPACHHIEYIFIETENIFEYSTPEIEFIADSIYADEYYEDDVIDAILEKIKSDKRTAISITVSGMACGPISSRVIYGFIHEAEVKAK